MSKAHKHADLMCYAAQHWHEAEYRIKNSDGNWSRWQALSEAKLLAWWADCEYEVRLIPRTVVQPKREVPAPETVSPQKGTHCWLASPAARGIVPFIWSGSYNEDQWLEDGLIYLSREDRDERVRAMLEIER